MIPACEELLSVHEAELVMHEPVASILNRAVVGTSTRECDYVGGSKTSLGHAVDVSWGPYADNRALAAGFAAKYICPVSKTACSKFKTAATLRPDRKSFAALEKALALIGTTEVQPRTLDNPAFVWKPSSRLAPLDQIDVRRRLRREVRTPAAGQLQRRRDQDGRQSVRGPRRKLGRDQMSREARSRELSSRDRRSVAAAG